MGRKKSKTRVHRQNKSEQERQNYFVSLKSFRNSTPDTLGLRNENLIGSDYINNSEAVESLANNYIPKSKKKKVIEWIKDNLVATIIATLLAGLLGFACSSIIDAKIKIAVIQSQIEHVEESISHINSSTINKDYLELEIYKVKQDFSQMLNSNYEDIEERLDTIEAIIEGYLN